MTQTQFHVTWKEHMKNIGSGFSTLQQNNEFVDMTLAADGHFVKVHQVLMALSSPYIKEIIVSADCKHPVIFLNKISYQTLSAILEYIYTGEVLVAVDNLKDFLDAAKELYIKGLQDMSLPSLLSASGNKKENILSLQSEFNETEIFDMAHQDEDMSCLEDNSPSNDLDETFDLDDVEIGTIKVTANNTLPSKGSDGTNLSALQYTVSNQGSLQMVLNRFIYYMKHTNRDKTRQWRCVDYLNKHRCPAFVVTKDDVVVQRIAAHTHPFHDKKILKKLKTGAIFSAITEAETEGNSRKAKLESHD